jgi:DNA-binding HxlR family transcriptional regulator
MGQGASRTCRTHWTALPTTLSERLRALEKNGVVERFYSISPPRAEYVLTAKGRDLGPILSAMRNWGRKYAR